MPMVQVNTEKLTAMVESWRAQAATRAIALKKLKERIREGKGKGGVFTAEGAEQALALVAEFYEREGRVKMLEELLRDLGQAVPGTHGAPAQASGGDWRLP